MVTTTEVLNLILESAYIRNYTVKTKFLDVVLV